MHVHLIGVAGTGMGALAILFREERHTVTGSDVTFDPPIGPALESAGVTCLRGWEAAHLEPVPDLVVVGNAIRKDNPEALSAKERGLASTSMSAALAEHFLRGRQPLVVCGTHGKTTTSAMCAWALVCAEREPGWFIGGIPKNVPSGASVGSRKRRLQGQTPFVVEGDEYDAVYWHKRPKFLDYVGTATTASAARPVVILTSVEHDHIDIYPDEASYVAAFVDLARAVPANGLIVCDASQALAVRTIREHAQARVSFYALEGDATGDVTPTWTAALAPTSTGGFVPFDVFGAGASFGRFALRVPGRHNVRNALATLAACAEGFDVPAATLRTALGSFEGVRRRQDLLGEPGGVRVYDDFAHHPTAVDETLRALRARHSGGALWAVFEPRSATACRNIHQEAYKHSFGAADHVLFAPLGRTNVPEPERLDTARLARELGNKAEAFAAIEPIIECLVRGARAGDTIALLSNGSFAGLHGRLLAALGERRTST